MGRVVLSTKFRAFDDFFTSDERKTHHPKHYFSDSLVEYFLFLSNNERGEILFRDVSDV